MLVELCYNTWATNSPGTNSTSTTPRQENGRAMTAGFTSGKTWSAEPTALTVVDDWLLTPNAGLIIYDFVLGKEYDCALAEGFSLRLTAPNAVNARATFQVQRA